MAPSSLKTDSPVARRIVRSFIDFLNSVEAAAPGADLEGLEVAKECLAEVFKLDSSSTSDCTKPDLLVNLFNSLEARGNNDLGIRSDPSHKETSVDAPSSSSVLNTGDTNLSNSSKSLANDRSRESFSGVSRDELFGQFFAALEKIHFFKTMPDGSDDPAQLDKATRLFHDAVTEMEAAGCQAFNQNNLAESLKSQGNRAMQSKLYLDAIELYTCAIALCENNAVYYCNRAAAYTQIHKYSEAIADCLKSIEIDPNYSKAYSRLGLAYYAQGNYEDAIDKGFKKALQLDPNNDSVKENIRVAEQKLNEEKQRTERDQNTSSASGTNQDSRNQSSGGSRNRATPFPSDGGSLPANFNITNNSLPADFASMLMNMAANAYQGQHSTSSASGTNQDSRNQSSGESRNHATPFQFTSIPADSGSLPADFASMFMNMAANAYQGQTGGDESNANSSSEPEIRLGGNTSLNFGEQMPEELAGALRSVMEMFSGAAAAPHGSSNTRDTANERPPN